jgi:hypothetical protein
VRNSDEDCAVVVDAELADELDPATAPYENEEPGEAHR